MKAETDVGKSGDLPVEDVNLYRCRHNLGNKNIKDPSPLHPLGKNHEKKSAHLPWVILQASLRVRHTDSIPIRIVFSFLC